MQGQPAAGYRPPPYALGVSAANDGGFQTQAPRGFPDGGFGDAGGGEVPFAYDSIASGGGFQTPRGFPGGGYGDAGGDEVPIVYGSSASGGGSGFPASSGGYGGSSNSGGTGGGSPALPEARAIPSLGVVVAEPYNARRANNIAATTVPIWQAAPPTTSVYLAPYGGAHGGRSPGVGERAGTNQRFRFGVGGVSGGVAAPSAPPLSPFLYDMASSTHQFR